MKKLSILAAALVASSAFAAPAFNYDNDAGALAFEGQRTRAEVMAELQGQRATGGEEFAIAAPSQSQDRQPKRERSEVHAEAVQAARDTLQLN